MAQNISSDLPQGTLTTSPGSPQKHLTLSREICQECMDVIDQHCPMTETTHLEEDDPILSKKLHLRLTFCSLSYFQKTTPNISLTHPHAIKSFKFLDRPWSNNAPRKFPLNIKNARGLLHQIAPCVEHLRLDPIYFHNNILIGIHEFPNLRELHIGHDKYTMHVNLQVLFSHNFPLLEGLFLCLKYSNETLMDEAFGNVLNFLANHKENLQKLHTKIDYSCRFTMLCDLPDAASEFDLSEKVEGIWSDGQLQLESLELLLPHKYAPLFTPIIASQKKLTNLTIGYATKSGVQLSSTCESPDALGTAGYQFPAISPGIFSSSSTLRTAIFHVSCVTCDGDWTILDLTVFRNAYNLTELELRGSCVGLGDHSGPPKENDGPRITNLNKVNSTSLKSLRIHYFIYSSSELQTLTDSAPLLETLQLDGVIRKKNADGEFVKSLEKYGKTDTRLLASMPMYSSLRGQDLWE